MKRVKQYVAKVVEEVYTHENKEETEKKGIEVILGAAKLIDKTTIRITPSDGGSPYTITTKATILSTGSSVNFPNFVTTLMQVRRSMVQWVLCCVPLVRVVAR